MLHFHLIDQICDLGLARKLTTPKAQPEALPPRHHAMTVCGTNEFMSTPLYLLPSRITSISISLYLTVSVSVIRTVM
jgi:serine/threonine protein kinase